MLLTAYREENRKNKSDCPNGSQIKKQYLKKKNPSFCKENCLTEYKVLIHPENTSSLQELLGENVKSVK